MVEKAGISLTLWGILMMFLMADMNNRYTIAPFVEKNMSILAGILFCTLVVFKIFMCIRECRVLEWAFPGFWNVISMALLKYTSLCIMSTITGSENYLIHIIVSIWIIIFLNAIQSVLVDHLVQEYDLFTVYCDVYLWTCIVLVPTSCIFLDQIAVDTLAEIVLPFAFTLVGVFLFGYKRVSSTRRSCSNRLRKQTIESLAQKLFEQPSTSVLFDIDETWSQETLEDEILDDAETFNERLGIT